MRLIEVDEKMMAKKHQTKFRRENKKRYLINLERGGQRDLYKTSSVVNQKRIIVAVEMIIANNNNNINNDGDG